jgi:hypothetical protein
MDRAGVRGSRLRPLLNGNRVRWAAGAAANIERRRRQQKGVSVILGAVSSQLFEIPEFSQWHSQQGDELLVESEVDPRTGASGFEGGVIGNDGGDSVVP